MPKTTRSDKAVARLSLDLNQAGVDILERMVELGGCETKREVVNSALTLLGWCVREIEKGNSIASVDVTREVYRELEMPLFDSVRVHAGRRIAGNA